MNPLTLWHRGYFLIVAGFTSWVGYIGFIRPTEILRALPWPVPPLHARFIGALYLSATVFLLLSLFARSWLQVRIIVQIAFIWTGWLLLITVLYWASFDFSRPQPWFWVVAYLAFPVAAAWLVLASQRRTKERAIPNIQQPWIRGFFGLFGLAFTVLAA